MHTEGDSATKIGKYMGYLAWLIGLALLTAFFSGVLEKQQNPNANPESYMSGDSTVVKLKRNRYGHYVSSGLINDYPVVFFLDTGATSVSIPQKVAEEIGLDKGAAAHVKTANGVITVYETLISRLTLGDIELTNVAAHINPQEDEETILLGMSALKQLEFSQKGNWLTLKQY